MLLAIALTVPIVAWTLALLRRYVIEADWALIPTALSMLPVALIVWAVLCEALRTLDDKAREAREGDPPK